VSQALVVEVVSSGFLDCTVVFAPWLCDLKVIDKRAKREG
jgi:hypothetical protein